MATRTRSPTDDLLIKWDKSTKDAILLRHLIEAGIVGGMGPKKIISSYVPFQKYTYTTFQSALNIMRRSYRNAVKRRSSDNSGK